MQPTKGGYVELKSGRVEAPGYGFFISVWCALVVQGWHTKEKELAYKWNVDSFELTPTPNPLSTAPVRQGPTLVRISAQLELTLPLSAQLKAYLTPI